MRNLLEQEKDFEVVGEAGDGEEAVRLGREPKAKCSMTGEEQNPS